MLKLSDIITNGILVAGLVFFLSACAVNPAPLPTQEDFSGEIGSLAITGVTVVESESVTFEGTTSLSTGECIFSQLYADDGLVDWWPSGKCFPLNTAAWRFSVPLGVEEAPQTLSADSSYRLEVWWPGNPEGSRDIFYFDLTSPPGE